MFLVLPFLAASYPSGAPTNVPTPPTTGAKLEGLEFDSAWNGNTAKALSTGRLIDGDSASDINSFVTVCCEPDDIPGPDCTIINPASESCVDDETEHEVRGWEDSSFVSFGGTKLIYAYNQFELAHTIGCLLPCLGFNTLALCQIHCGEPIEGPLRENDEPSAATSPANRIYEADIAGGAWDNSPVARVNSLNTFRGERGASIDHTGNDMAFSGDVETTVSRTTFQHNDLFTSSLSSGDWATAANVDTDYSSTSSIHFNTVCEEENPHLVRDDDGLRMYFDSDRDPATGPPWDGLPSAECNDAKLNLWVTEKLDSGGGWSGPVEVNLPAAATSGANWPNSRRGSPFVTALDPALPSEGPYGRFIYWSGRENDCYPGTGSIPTDEKNASIGCIYRAEQGDEDDLDAAWTNVVKIMTPTPVQLADYGQVGVVTDVSLTGDDGHLYFTYLVRDDFPDDVKPPVDDAETLDDVDNTDPENPIPLGLQFTWGNWRFPKGLEVDVNWDASGDTSGWEDSPNIMPDGRAFYFAYSALIFGQGSKAGPDPAICGDNPGDCPGRAVYPRFLASESASLKRPNDTQTTDDDKVGLSIYEATIDTTNGDWDVLYSSVNYSTYCTPDAQCSGCDNVCIDRSFDDDHRTNDWEKKVLSSTDDDCVHPDEQGMMEGAPTVSVDSGGLAHMVFVRYGDLRVLTATLSNPPPKELFSFKLYETSRNCSGEWCEPDNEPLAISSSHDCFDNDPHLTEGGAELYFDSNRSAEANDKCFKFLAEDWKVYHSRKACGAQSNEWCTPKAVDDGPNLAYVLDTNPACSGCPSNCPIFCTGDSSKVGKRVFGGSQAFVTDDGQTMYFLGDGPDCNANVSNPVTESAASTTGPCIYMAKRVGTTNDPPKFGVPLLVVRPAVADARPCQYDDPQDDPDIGRIIGLGEPSVTKDGRLRYFVYAKKTGVGTPLNTSTDISDCTGTSDPSDLSEPLCKCTASNKPDGCWMDHCSDVADPDPPNNCKDHCDDRHISGALGHDCLPLSVFYCKEPRKSQTATQDGVDTIEFGIGVARKDFWDPSIGVVSAQ